MSGEEIRAEFLLLTPSVKYYPQHWSLEISTDWMLHSLADCLIGYEDLITIQELFLNVGSILHKPKTVDLHVQQRRVKNTIADSYLA